MISLFLSRKLALTDSVSEPSPLMMMSLKNLGGFTIAGHLLKPLKMQGSWDLTTSILTL